MEEIEKMMNEGTISNALKPLETALSHLPKIPINDKVAEKVKNGAVLELPLEYQELEVGSPIAVYSED
jgi:tRNA pseudouridine55 synthase